MSNINMLLLPIFIQKLRGLHSIIIMKTLLKQFYYTEKYVRSNLMRYGTHHRKKIICRLAIRGIKHFFGSYNQHQSACIKQLMPDGYQDIRHAVFFVYPLTVYSIYFQCYSANKQADYAPGINNILSPPVGFNKTKYHRFFTPA